LVSNASFVLYFNGLSKELCAIEEKLEIGFEFGFQVGKLFLLLLLVVQLVGSLSNFVPYNGLSLTWHIDLEGVDNFNADEFGLDKPSSYFVFE